MPTAVLSEPLAGAPPTAYALVPDRCAVEFAVRTFGVTHVIGRAHALGGVLVLADDPADSWVRVDVGADSLRTGRRSLDDALRTGDLFDCAEFGIVRFESTEVRPTGDDRADVEGDLYLGELVGPVTFSTRLLRIDDYEVAVAATATLSRREWGLTWGSAIERAGVVSDTVRITAAARFCG